MSYHNIINGGRGRGIFETIMAVFVMLSLGAAPARAQVHLWSLAFQNTDTVFSLGLATDAAGNVYVTGYFNGTVDFGDGPRTERGLSGDIFLVKYSPQGVCRWSKTFGNDLGDAGTGLCTDQAGNVYLTGSFRKDVDFGGGPLLNAGWHLPNFRKTSKDIFVAKFDASGNHIWSYRYGDQWDDQGDDIGVDSAGNFTFTGRVNQYDQWTSSGFIYSYDSTGAYRWGQTFGTTGINQGSGVAVDGAGNVVFTGGFIGTIGLGGSGLTAEGIQDLPDIFLAKYDQNGVHQWSQRFGGGDQDEGYGVAVDHNGNIAMTGYFTWSVQFGTTLYTRDGGKDVFLATFDPAGNDLWAHIYGNQTRNNLWADWGNAVAFDPAGNVFMTGRLAADADFGGGTLLVGNYYSTFLAGYDAAGNHLLSQVFRGESGDVNGRGLSLRGTSELWLSGYMYNAVDFGGGPRTGASNTTDGFLAKFAVLQPTPTISAVSDVPDDEGGFVTVDFVRSVYDAPGSSPMADSYQIYRWSRFDWIPVQVGSVAASQQDRYSIIVPTAFDNLGNPFRVDAHVSAAIYATPYVSGASVDNLAPATPTGIAAAYQATGTLLGWNDSPEPDLGVYRVYRNTDPFFVPLPADLVQEVAGSNWTDATPNPWSYHYKISAVDISGNESNAGPPTTTSAVPDVNPAESLALYNAAPNPFNPATSIRYYAPSAGRIRLVVFDAAGHAVRTLVEGFQDAGVHTARWDGKANDGHPVASGVYFCRLREGPRTQWNRMVLVR